MCHVNLYLFFIDLPPLKYQFLIICAIFSGWLSIHLLIMTWIMSRIIAKFIEEDKIDKVQLLLQPYSFLERRHIISKKCKKTSLLYIAVKAKHLLLVNYMLDECGADPNDTGYENGLHCPCLWKAADLNELQIAQSLIKHGADVNGVNCLKTTPLFIACHHGNLAMIYHLYRHGANINSDNFEGFTCLMMSVIYPEICSYLLSKGAKVDAVNNSGENALMLAINYKKLESVSYLLAAGADPTIKNYQGENSIYMAAKNTTWTQIDNFKTKNHNICHYIALSSAIASCKYTINGFKSVAYTQWIKALNLWNLPLSISMYETKLSRVSISELNPVKPLLDPKDAQAIIFLESSLGLRNIFTLKLMKIAISKVESIDDRVNVFNYFLDLIDSIDNDIFFKMFEDIDDLVRRFYLPQLYHFFREEHTREYAIVKSFVAHLGHVRMRLIAMGQAAMLAKSFHIKIYFDLILHMIETIVYLYPRKVSYFQEYVRKMIKLDLRLKRNVSLLHFSMQKNYPWTIVKFLISCGADVNSLDDFGNTPAHLALKSSEYCTEKVIDCFLQYGLILDKITQENSCLLCLLKKNNLLGGSFRCSKLECMAAIVMAKYGLSVNLDLPEIIEHLIRSHFEI